jgi:hypothetical protein
MRVTSRQSMGWDSDHGMQLHETVQTITRDFVKEVIARECRYIATLLRARAHS